MPNEFLDIGLKDKKRAMPNENHKEGFVDAVKNAQPRLAMSYLTEVINELADEVRVLAERVLRLEGDQDAEKIEELPEEVVAEVEKISEAKPAVRKRAAKVTESSESAEPADDTEA